MSEKRYLFISNSDLADTDANGRTLRDAFSYVDEKQIYSFCTLRKNKNLPANHVFYINEGVIFKPRLFLKTIHAMPLDASASSSLGESKRRIKKNPLTCLLRNLVWSFNFLFFKKKLKAWIAAVGPDVLIFDPADFIFMHKIALYIAKIAKKPLTLYNTEDFYFKTWNYLHKENGFGWLFPKFRRKLCSAYKKTFAKTVICLHNVEGLKELYEQEFPAARHYVAYHTSRLVVDAERSKKIRTIDFYYCGNLDKGRDRTIALLSESIARISPKSRIYFNGRLSKTFDVGLLGKAKNVVDLGFVAYQEVQDKLKQDFILLSVASLDEYDAKDKYHCFSTKLSDYVASCNPIIHIGPVGDEYLILKKYNLAYVCDDINDIDATIKNALNDLNSSSYDKFLFQQTFYDRFLNPESASLRVRKIVEGAL